VGILIKIVLLSNKKMYRQIIKSLITFRKMDINLIGETSDGEYGLRMCLKSKPDIILADMGISGQQGLTLLERIREHLPLAKIIIISSNSDFQYVQNAIKCGVFEYLLDPIQENDLIRAFERAVNETQKLMQQREMVKRLKSGVKKLQNGYTGLNHGRYALRSKSENAVIQKALLYIQENINEDLSLENVSSKVFLNSVYFCKLFKREMGEGFNEYVSKLRMKKAESLLMIPEIKINEISNMLGFNSGSYFIKVFRKHFGLTPSEYRCKYKQDNGLHQTTTSS